MNKVTLNFYVIYVLETQRYFYDNTPDTYFKCDYAEVFRAKYFTDKKVANHKAKMLKKLCGAYKNCHLQVKKLKIDYTLE